MINKQNSITNRFAICYDPESQIYYSINLDNYDLHIQIFSDQKKQKWFKQKGKKAFDQVKSIISFQREGHCETQQLWRYRRRRLPDYLLKQAKTNLPSYIIEDTLPIALTECLDENEQGDTRVIKKNEINIQVHLTEYFDYIRSKQPYRSDPGLEIPKLFGCKLKLVSSVNEVIKIICKMAYQQKGIELFPLKSENKLILKVLGNDDYWYGNTPIMNYVHVRKCLRNREIVSVVLTEKKIIQHGDYRKWVIYRKKSQVDVGKFSEANWSDLQQEQPILWYPPFSLNKQAINQINNKQIINRQFNEANEKIKEIKKENYYYKNAQTEKLKLKQLLLKKVIHQKPRFLIKQNSIKTVELRRTQTQKKIVSIREETILSGQCEYKYEFKLIGVSSLLRVYYHHPKYTKQMNLQQKRGNLFIGHANYGTQFLTNIKKFGLINMTPFWCYLKINLTYGDKIFRQYTSKKVMISNTVKFQECFSYFNLSFLPMEAKLFFQIYSNSIIKIVTSKDGSNTEGLGCAGISIFDEYGCLRQGKQELRLWPFKTIDLRVAGTLKSYNILLENQRDYTKIFLQKVQWGIRDITVLENLGYKTLIETVTKFEQQYRKGQDLAQLKTLLEADPLKMMDYTEKQKQILRMCKVHYIKLPDKFINYIYSLDYSKPDHIPLSLEACKKWEILNPLNCLFLLSPKVMDEAIRFYAVQRIVDMTDGELILYMLQLVQCLSAESHHQNPLSQLLLQKSLKNPFNVEHSFFWQLKSQLTKQVEFQRYAAYVQSLAMLSTKRLLYINQIKANQLLTTLNRKIIAEGKDTQAKTQYLIKKGLQFLKSNLPKPFVLAINPEKQNRDFLQSQCKVLDSKKIPLFLTLTQNDRLEYRRKNTITPISNSKQKPELLSSSNRMEKSSSNTFRNLVLQKNFIQQRIIFKYGDDIRQDQLTLQLLQIMDNIWLQAGYDFKMTIYRVLPIGQNVGYIQVVENAETNSKIHKDYGGSAGALVDQTTLLYLKKFNPTNKQYIRARDNFIKSQVGYLVSTYVLGIGDRHSGNVMVSKNGMFFHIDFGHFLGNFKLKFNIKRQRSPFLFTSEFAHVMGGKDNKLFKQFEQLCGIAYNLIRKKADFLISMFLIMVPTGIPQLSHYSDVQYLVDKLALNLSNRQATEKIKMEIHASLQKQTSRRLDNLVHEIKRTG